MNRFARLSVLARPLALAACVGSTLAVIGLAAPAPARADGGAAVATVIAEEGGRLVREQVTKAFRRWRSEHTRYYPDGGGFNVPMSDLSGSRISFNFNHRSWVPRGSRPVSVRITIHGVPDEVRNQVRLVMKADKQGRKDRDRSTIVRHGSVFQLGYGTSGDRAYYFVERGSDVARRLPAGAYIRLERV